MSAADHVDQLRSEGKLDSKGEFRLDHEKAREKIIPTMVMRGSRRSNARGEASLSGSIEVTSSATSGWPPSRMSCPVLAARFSARFIGPNPHPVSATNRAKTMANRLKKLNSSEEARS